MDNSIRGGIEYVTQVRVKLLRTIAVPAVEVERKIAILIVVGEIYIRIWWLKRVEGMHDKDDEVKGSEGNESQVIGYGCWKLEVLGYAGG